MGTLTVNATNGQTVAAGASYTVSYPAGKSAADYLATGAKITTSDGSIYSATVSFGASSITITNPTGRAIASGGFDYLDMNNAGVVARFGANGESDVLLGPQSEEVKLVSSTTNPLTEGIKQILSGNLDVVGSMSLKIGKSPRLLRPCAIAEQSVATGGTAARTWTNAFTAWGPFHAASALFLNPTGSAVTIDNMCMAPTADAVMLGVNMVQPSGGSAAFTSPTGTLTLSTVGSAANPGINWTSPIAVRSVPRSDGTPFPALLVRTYSVAAPNYFGGPSFNALLDGTFAAGSGGHIFGTGNVGGDKVTSPSGWTTSSGVDSSGPSLIVSGINFEYDYRMRTIFALGDSIIAGETSATKPLLSAPFLATLQLSLAGKKVAFQQGGFGGQTAAQTDTRGRSMLAAILPDIVVLPCWTPNTAASTQADWDSQWVIYAGLAEYALSLNIIPVFITPWPKSGLNGTQITARNTQRARVIASGLPYADIEAAVAVTATGDWIGGYSGDGTHGTTSAYALMAPILADAITPLVS